MIASTLDEILICPHCSSTVETAGRIDCPRCGAIARWIAAERRIEWSQAGMDDVLAKRVASERHAWDAWAEGARVDVLQASAEAWLGSSRTMRSASRAAPGFTHLAGKRMLDIGSTCRHSVKFLKAGLERLDQIEVSPESQRFALLRLQAEGVDLNRVRFHTVPAETLPFAAESFDLVFSSGTIHHTDRSFSLPEVHRVLKPGGQFLFIESYLPSHLHPLKQAWRRVRKVDRGTDEPLSGADLRLMRRLFRDVQLYPFNVVWLAWSQTFGRTRWGRARREAIARFDERIGDAWGLARLLATQCWVAGRKA
jgi:SAM-dependent methyltransferase